MILFTSILTRWIRADPSLRTSPPGVAMSRAAYPQLTVLDLDDCVWSPEMFTLSDMPSDAVIGDLNGRGEGVVGVRSGAETIKIFPGALQALQECADDVYSGMRLGVASSADTPFAARIAHASLGILEVLPGLTLRELLGRGFEEGFEGNVWIGRTPPLSSNKAKTHFPLLKEATGVPYDGMLFFDDSNWSDHCTMVAQNCKGVITQRTPRGMQYSEWKAGLGKYDKRYGTS
ncbi:hypothetical protein CTAYLR_006974 [Chrysophaeum taylorii]|uniref:Magnesium-dependent phosphatase-1 n=1 Tax=Chrysophaeum taylorii TaxID=2483200 RepID=A0AAD7U9P6_9STRA|nr:hypothetical protein CTAYLR_006974 [Chrysophaeum taylorii]